MPAKTRIYLLESAWKWDETHIERATITIEGYEHERVYEKMTEEELNDSKNMQVWYNIAHEQKTGLSGSTRLVALYKVKSPESLPSQMNVPSSVLHMELELVCTFDAHGIAHKVKPAPTPAAPVSPIGAMPVGCEE